MSEHIARDVAARMHLAPVFHHPGHGEVLAANLRALAGARQDALAEAWAARKADLVMAYGLPADDQRKPFAFSAGKAIIPVHGTLINRFSASWGFVTGYQFIRAQVSAAAADDDVDTIVLDVNSFGGMAAGAMETADLIYSTREIKPSVAIIDAYAFSAGYAIASAASRVVAIPSGGAGSIGVVAMHISIEKALKDFGVEVTFIHAGAKKVDGNPYEALSKSAKADIQHQVDELYGQFVTTVSRNRGLSEKAVRATEAATFTASDAKAAGLIDAVVSPASALETESRDGDDVEREQSRLGEEGHMPEEKKDAPATVSQAQIDAAVAEGVKKALADYTARVAAITGHEAARGRETLANHLATQTDLSAEAAIAVLQAAPTAATAEPKAGDGAFQRAMDKAGSPDVGAGDKPGAEKGGDKVAQILGAFTAATGFDPAKAETKH